jgi:eukaryotic-like serine/threonine-protein kinase
MMQPRRDEDLFAAARAMPSAEREHFLARACRDATARRRLTTLLDAFDDAVDFDSHRSLEAEHGFEQLRSYRLLQELGEGGCGIAYLAEQLAPVKRQVALKVIKPGMDTKAVVARFEAERQLLALMDHPNVAKVFDAGSTASGRPFFVMELVQGIRITEYCEQMQLSITERLQLFVQVCHAIQHAHHKGVMHRDIKPSNVLVTMHDGQPMVKVIDFGIAKAIQGPLSEQTLHTALDQFLGTPAYISPEQTELGQRNVDTRSDIYSLGVLLYELLTGCTPLDTEELLQSSADEMRRRVREEEPLIPSARLKEVRGDLDWIVMRCLEKEPARRYQTVSDVSAELHRYLRHEPIEARPPDLGYRIRKFSRRNRTMVAALLGAAIFIVAFAINTSIQTRRVTAERDRVYQESETAKIVSAFMEQIFDASQPLTAQGRTITARDLLDEAGRRIRGDLNQRPEVRARLLEAIGRAYRRLDLFTTAVPYLEDALRLRRQLPDPDGMRTASVLIELAMAVRKADDLPRAESLLAEALAISKQHHAERSATYAKLLLDVGRVHLAMGNLTDSRTNLQRSRELFRSLFGSLHTDIGNVDTDLASVFLWQDNLAAAEQAAREGVQIFAATRPPTHPDRVDAEVALAQVLQRQGRISEAAELFENSLAAWTKLYGPNSPKVGDVLDSLAGIKKAQGMLAEAEDYAQRSLRAQEVASGKEHTGTAYERTVLAAILVQRGKYSEAQQQAQLALTAFQKALPPDHQYIASAEHVLGEALLGAGQLKDAEAALTAAINRWKHNDALAWRVARSESALGEVLYRLGRNDEAERYLKRSYAALAADEHADKEARVKAQQRVSQFYTDRGQREQLDQLLFATRSDGAAAPDRAN